MTKRKREEEEEEEEKPLRSSSFLDFLAGISLKVDRFPLYIQ